MSNVLYRDMWSHRRFRTDPVKVENVLDKVREETNNKIYDGELVYMGDIMNYIYRELGLPEYNNEREYCKNMSNRNNMDFFRYNLDPYDDDDETEIQLYTWFEK